MSSVVETLEAKLLIPFENLAKRLSNQFPNVSAQVYSHSVGSATEYQGHSIGVSCLLADSPEPNNVVLEVCLAYLTTRPKIYADVCWGHPSGHIEAEFPSESVIVIDKVLEDLYAELPRLSESLVEAVRRRKPSDA
jgi:hypothetical protein